MSLNGDALISHTLVAEDHRIKQEHLYMKLLEQRISQLEAQIQSSVAPTTTKQVDESTPEDSDDEPAQAEAGVEDLPPDSEDQGSTEPAALSRSASNEEDTESNAAKESTAASRVRNILRKWDDDEEEYIDSESGVGESDNDTKEPTRAVTTFYRVIRDKELKDEKIEIESHEVRKLYFECCPNKDGQKHEQGETLELRSPFVEFVWYYDAFVKACEPQTSDSTVRKEAREDLKQLLQLVRKSSLEPYFKIRDMIEATGMIRYEHLWSIFPPGERVYCKPLAPKFPDWQMLEVEWYGYAGETNPKKNTRLWLYGFDCDGTKFEKYSYIFKIRSFKEEKAIDSLEVFPKRFYRNAEKRRDDCDLQAELMERGIKWADLCATDARDSQHSYDGPSITYVAEGSTSGAFSRHDDETATSTSQGDDDDRGFTSITPDIHGIIIVDNYLFLRSERNEVGYSCPPLGRIQVEDVDESDCQCRVCQVSPARQWTFDMADDLEVQRQKFAESEERLKMCPPKILGYALKDKIWTQFRVKNIIKHRGKGGPHSFWHELQLEEKYKNTLMAFITNHESSRRRRLQQKQQSGRSSNAMPDSFDIVEGKGKGLAILLHGAPGVGKTLTAETVALATGRPLTVVSVADLGTVAQEAESRLNRIFNDAARWEAILLMDEADVFLEAREKTEDPNRNALVSVLLRCLEYYEGIIILTTNRIRSFDVAVQSRMHLAIQYTDLSKEHKVAIYKNLLSKIPKRHLHHELREEKTLNRCLETLCRKDKINGRQIRNIVASAMALANYRGEEEEYRGVLMPEDLQDVYEMTAEFISSLNADTVAMRRNNEIGK